MTFALRGQVVLISVIQTVLRSLGVDAQYYESRPSLVSIILLAHDPAYTFSTQTLTAFFPIILSSIQSNVALDEVLSILLSSLAPLRSQTPRPELSVDFVIPLVHLLPHVASNHSEPEVRHYNYRILSLVLGLSPSPIRFRLLHDLLGDKEVPPQMRVAAVGLLKEAVLESFTTKDKNMFASPLLLSTFGPIVLRPDPPDLLDSVSLDDFLDSAEPLRMVECLGFYYVLLLRDTHNQVRGKCCSHHACPNAESPFWMIDWRSRRGIPKRCTTGAIAPVASALGSLGQG